MQLVLIRDSEFQRSTLPEKISGQHPVYYEFNGENKLLFIVEAENGKWIIKQNKSVELVDGYYFEDGIKKVDVCDNAYFFIRQKHTNETMIVMVESKDIGHSIFRLYAVPSDGLITVGHDENSHISFHNSLLSKNITATIQYESDGSITVSGGDRMNGAYLNGKRIKKSKAFWGDELYLLGLRVILGAGFVAVNNPGIEISLKPRELQTFKPMEEDGYVEAETPKPFSSAPRFKKGLKETSISVETPPSPSQERKLPWIVLMGPSVTMALGSVFTSLITIQNIGQSGGSVLPTIVMSASMVAGTILWPTVSRKYETKERLEKEEEQKQKYQAYLEKIKGDIQIAIGEQEKIRRDNDPSIEECISRIKEKKMTLWERSPNHDDFLEIMIGKGDMPADIKLSYQKPRAIEQESISSKAMMDLVESERVLKNVPITVSFQKNAIVGVIGIRKKVIQAVMAYIIELTALHNYVDLKLMFIYSEAERDIWGFTKWIPHVWNNERTVRYIANDVEEAKELSGILSNIQAMNGGKDGGKSDSPHYLIIAADRMLASKVQALKEFSQSPSQYGNVSLMALYDERGNLPKNCSVIINYSEQLVTVAGNQKESTEIIGVNQPVSYSEDAEDIFIQMSNIELDIASKEGYLPSEMSYFEMCKVGMPEHLDITTKWEENDPVNSLAVPIGVDADGYNINLDIHEKAHGPHGLIAGMTGSGKSEFIISYIASLAVNFSPEEVAFVLIDFKGGGMADVFKNLPHLAGSITNLDGNELQRSFIAIESELEKRQALFKEISEYKKISNIDIYKYQKLRKEDKSLKPLPHLIIISDEFAELKQQHADFMEQLIRIARIGRSLGVHLILATQKPDGVVDDQIRSNIKFKVCLKVQDKADSQSVIGRPDATMITNAGRFYLQVGYNEIFEYGQSPWSGAPYHPEDQYRQTGDKKVEVLNEQGQVIYRLVPPKRPNKPGVPEKQIDALVEYLRTYSEEKGYICEKLWLEPLAGPVEKAGDDALMDDLEYRPYVLNPVVGLYDDLRNQKHRTLTVPLTNGGNAIVYGASGSGKLAFLNQLMVSLIEKHKPEEVKIYAIDFDAGSLTAFDQAPQVGKVVLADETDALNAVFDDLTEQLEWRKQEFRRFGGEYQNYVHHSGKTVPNLVLIINNFLAFTEGYTAGEDLVAKLAREGKKYGIFVVLTSLDASGVRYSLVPMFSNLYVLQQNNEDQYDAILGKTGGILPARFVGRGIFKRNHVTYEFQTKMVFEDQSNTYEAIVAFCEQKAREMPKAKEMLKLLPERIDQEYFVEQGLSFELSKFPIGVDAKSKNPVTMDFTKSKAFAMAYDQNNEAAMQAIYESLVRNLSEIRYVMVANGTESGEKVVTGSEEITKAIFNLEKLVYERAELAQKEMAEGKGLPDFEHVVVIIKGYHDLCDAVSGEDLNHLTGLLEGITVNYHLHFVFIDDMTGFRDATDVNRLGRIMPFEQGLFLTDDYRVQSFLPTGLELMQECKRGFGYCLQKNKLQYLKLPEREE